MLDNGKVPLFAQQGCWLTCHTGMRDTPNQVVGDPVKKHPLFSDAKYDPDIRKYLASARTDDAFIPLTHKSGCDMAALGYTNAHMADLFFG